MQTNKYRQLFSETVIYASGLILTRGVSFLLVPLYTNFLSHAQYGLISLAYAFIGFMTVILAYGSDAALLKYYVQKSAQKKDYFSTVYAMLFITTALFFLFGYGFRRPLSALVLGNHQTEFFVFCNVIIFFDVLNSITMLIFRAENRARFYVFFGFLNASLQVGLNLYLVGKLRLGITGIFYSNMISSAVIWLLTLYFVVRRFRFRRIALGSVKTVLQFGLPFLPSGIFAMLLELADRYLLRIFTDLESVGLYNAGYKMGMLMLLFVYGFNAGWHPFFLKESAKSNARATFAKITTYVVLVLVFLWVVFCMWFQDLVKIPIAGRHLIAAEYWSGLKITPIIWLAYIFRAFYLLQLPGIYNLKKTKYAPLFRGLGAGSNIILNIILIPHYGLLGAAYATLIAFIIMAVAIFILNRRIYPIPYEWSRIIRVIIIGLGCYFAYYLLNSDAILVRLAVTALFPIGIWITGFLSRSDRLFLRKLFSHP